MSQSLKRIFIDIGGYGLILLGVATGWLPGGLALLSLHNAWARRLRNWLLRHGADFILYLFPKNPKIQLLYDFIAGIILVIIAWLVWNQASVWQIGLASALFLFVLMIVGMNRDRIIRIKRLYGKRPKLPLDD
jgi:sulfite exporter TauE/SafE